MSTFQMDAYDSTSRVGSVVKLTGAGNHITSVGVITSIAVVNGIRNATVSPDFAASITTNDRYQVLAIPSALLDTPGTSTLLSRVGVPMGASVSADIAANGTVVTAIKLVTDKLLTMIAAAGAGLYQFTAAALGLAPSTGGGGSGTVTTSYVIGPFAVEAESARSTFPITASHVLSLFVGNKSTIQLRLTADGQPFAIPSNIPASGITVTTTAFGNVITAAGATTILHADDGTVRYTLTVADTAAAINGGELTVTVDDGAGMNLTFGPLVFNVISK